MSLFIPETIVLTLTVILLCTTLIRKESSSTVLLDRWVLMSTAVIFAGILRTLPCSGSLFHSTYTVDLLSQGFKLILALAFFFTVLFSKDLFSVAASKKTEYYIFLTTGLLGMMMIPSAADLLTLYIALELSSYSLYLLAAMRSGRTNAESSVKYILFGAASSGVLLWGFSLLAGITGTTSLVGIAAKAPALLSEPVFLLGIFFSSFAFLFKLSAFPAHFWAPDVYENASTPVTTYIATASKAAAVAVLIRFFHATGISAPLVAIIGVLAFFSMTLGNTVALVQKDVKRLLAYSSIAQAGYILVGLLAGTAEGYSSAFFYALAYVLMNAGAFMAVNIIAKDSGNDNPEISHFDGLAERSPFLSLILLLSLLSLAGIPPLVGFTGKWILFTAAMEKGHWFLVLWGVLNSVVSLFYYLTLVKHVYLEKPKNARPLILSTPMKALGLLLFAAIVFLGIFPNGVIVFAQSAISTAHF